MRADDETYSDDVIRKILSRTRRIAMVGVSANSARPSWFVMKYLQARGFRVFPVNPGLAGQTLHGMDVVVRLADISAPIDMVDIFRGSEAAGGVVDEALALDSPPRTIWMQLSVSNPQAAERARARGLDVVMNRCPKIEYARLSGEIGWNGVNSGIISAKKPAMMTGFQKYTLDRD